MPLLVSCYGAHGLLFEVGQLCFKIAKALQSLIPALLESCGDQPVVGVYGVITALGEIGFILGPLCLLYTSQGRR